MERDIPGACREVCEGLTYFFDHLDSADFEARPILMERLKNWIRESYQDLFKEQAKTIVMKLKSNEPLDAEEQSILENWMVGDLEMYLRLELHYQAWVQRLKALCRRLQNMVVPGIEKDSKKLNELRGMMLEIDHLYQDITQYKYNRDRIQRYQTFISPGIENLNDEQRNELADHLKNMIYSSLE